MKSTRWTRNAILNKRPIDCGEDVRSAVWQSALDETAKGWLQGPHSKEELGRKLGPLFVVSRRFGLQQQQQSKIRPIDNMSESLVNAAFAASYKLERLHARSWKQLFQTVMCGAS